MASYLSQFRLLLPKSRFPLNITMRPNPMQKQNLYFELTWASLWVHLEQKEKEHNRRGGFIQEKAWAWLPPMGWGDCQLLIGSSHKGAEPWCKGVREVVTSLGWGQEKAMASFEARGYCFPTYLGLGPERSCLWLEVTTFLLGDWSVFPTQGLAGLVQE